MVNQNLQFVHCLHISSLLYMYECYACIFTCMSGAMAAAKFGYTRAAAKTLRATYVF